tara:strand:- start:198 stop:689 length:492 start_codon:yes stop_codon:yes gene_type:complete
MIIECVNCSKKFNVNSNLIPEDGRQIICGSCNHSWHFKKENFLKTLLNVNDKNVEQDASLSINNTNIKDPPAKIETTQLFNDVTNDKSDDTQTNLNHKNNLIGKKINNFFSYLLLFIISFVVLIILLDTLKSPLIKLFPGLEILLFNLFEILKDIKLFIINLT